ncbi:MAG: class I SAM-dependent methyltransferase [Ginsengibacter sp.]
MTKDDINYNLRLTPLAKNAKQLLYNLLTRTTIGKRCVEKIGNRSFKDSASYWENRYRKNGNSGAGSYGIKAAYKAGVINQFVEEKNIKKVIELGCGDGNQLQQFHFAEYIGLDVSPTAIRKCEEIFREDTSKKFFGYEPALRQVQDDIRKNFISDLSLSLDVIYHLVEDEVFETYMRSLFSMSFKYVIIYAWDIEEPARYHVRHRKFTQWISENISGFQLIDQISKDGFCVFFIYEKI